MVKGTKRLYEKDEVVGSIWAINLLHLPRTNEGHQYALVLVERLVGYLVCMPLKAIYTQAINTAFRNILCCLPPMKVIISDRGSADFGPPFTRLLCEMGIKHESSLSNRS